MVGVEAACGPVSMDDMDGVWVLVDMESTPGVGVICVMMGADALMLDGAGCASG